MVRRFSNTLFISVLFIIAQASLSTSIEVTISPTCSGRNSLCRTLSTLPTGNNLTLVFEPGVHTVPSPSSFSSLTIQRKQYLELKGNGQATISCIPERFRANINFLYNFKTVISGLKFSGCNIESRQTNNTIIKNTRFMDGSNGALEFTNCENVTIDKSQFMNNSDSSFGGVVEFSNTIGIEITRSNYSDNHVSSFAGVIGFSASAGKIGCTNFYNNSANSFGGIVTLERSSVIFVSNSSFRNSTLSSFGGVIYLDSIDENVIVTSSVFVDTQHSSFGGVITLDSSKSHATIIASKFINTLGRSSRGGTAVYSRGGTVELDCFEFINTTVPIQYVRNNTGFCDNFDLDTQTTCEDTSCSLTDCGPPEVRISLEKSEYIVSEEIGISTRALQVCASAKDIPFQIQVNLQIYNGSATEGEDFISGSPDCRVLKFYRKVGIQKNCAYIRILEDSLEEGDEQFYVGLETLNPQVVFKLQRATVTITENEIVPPSPESTNEMSDADTPSLPPSPVTAKPGFSKTALVECGPLRREITYTSGGNDLLSLRTAIVEAYRGLTGIQSGHIALLQVKSDQHGDYLDKLFQSSEILPNNSQVKVITYESFTCQPRFVPGN